MKKVILMLLCSLVFLFSGCRKNIPSLNAVNENGAEWAQEKLQRYKIDDFLSVWGSFEDNWKTSESEGIPGENGYLWFADADKTTAVIIYVDNEKIFQSIALSKDVTENKDGTVRIE